MVGTRTLNCSANELCYCGQVLGTKNPTDASLVLSKMEKILSKIGNFTFSKGLKTLDSFGRLIDWFTTIY